MCWPNCANELKLNQQIASHTRCLVTYHRRHRQYARHESMDTMFHPDNCDACPFICVFTFETESYGRSTQITVIFLYAFGDTTVESCIGDGNIFFILILGHHLNDYISMRREEIKISEPKKDGKRWKNLYLPVFHSDHFSSEFLLANNSTEPSHVFGISDSCHNKRQNLLNCYTEHIQHRAI